MWIEYLRIAQKVLRTHKFRSILTVLSITIGAFSIVLMSSLAQSGLTTLMRNIEEIGGARLLFISPKKPLRMERKAESYSSGITLADRDLLYGALAVSWLVLSWREPRGGLLFVLGPLLAPFSALALLPLAAATLRAAPRRAVQAGAAVLVAALVAGVRHAALPIVGGAPPLGLGIAGARDPLDVAGSLARAAGAHPALLVEAGVFAAVALALPYAHARGRWGAAILGGAMLVGTVATVPSAPAVPLAFAAWLTAAAVALRARRA